MRFASIFSFLPQNLAYAHCDIPCGIYDPHQAQVAAHTIIRMTQMLGEVKRDPSASSGQARAEHDIARITHVKEEHSNILEHELVTLEKDYFKEEHFEKFANLRELFESVSKLGAKARVGIDAESARELLETVMQIAEIFFKSKGLESARVKAPYPTGFDIVVQK